MNERQLTHKIINKLKQLGGYWIKTHGNPFQKSGLSDIIGCFQGRFIALEVKLPKKRSNLTLRQKIFLQKIKEAGGISAVITSQEEVINLLKPLLKERG